MHTYEQILHTVGVAMSGGRYVSRYRGVRDFPVRARGVRRAGH